MPILGNSRHFRLLRNFIYFQIQFVIIFYHNFSVMFRDCNYPKFINFLLALNSGLFLYMFGMFYYINYVKIPRKNSKTGITTGVVNGNTSDGTTIVANGNKCNGTTEIANGNKPNGTTLVANGIKVNGTMLLANGNKSNGTTAIANGNKSNGTTVIANGKKSDKTTFVANGKLKEC